MVGLAAFLSRRRLQAAPKRRIPNGQGGEKAPMSEPTPEEIVSTEEARPALPAHGTEPASTLGTLSRLLIGGALLGRDAISAAMASTAGAVEAGSDPLPDDQVAFEDRVVTPTSLPRPSPSPRHLLIGALFDTGERLDRRGAAALRLVGKVTSPAGRWARRSRLTAPARRRFDDLSARGEAQIRRWVERGVLEEQRSRALLNTTVSKATNASLDRVVDSAQVQGLVEEFVQAQGQSLGRKMLDELRAVAVSGDRAVARLAHRLLRHPRSEIPPFPRAVPAPTSEATALLHLQGRAAGFVSRLVAFQIDVVLVSILIRGTGWLLEDIRMATGTYFALPGLTPAASSTMPIQVTVAGGLVMSAAYLLFFWALAGVTPGKGLMGLRIVTRDGHPLSLIRSAVRLFGYLVSLLLYALGYWWIAIDHWREGWHDKIARTAVIYMWDAHPSARSLRNLMGGSEDLPQQPTGQD